MNTLNFIRRFHRFSLLGHCPLLVTKKRKAENVIPPLETSPAEAEAFRESSERNFGKGRRLLTITEAKQIAAAIGMRGTR